MSKYRQGPLALDPSYIKLKRQIGNGFFGEVFLASLPAKTEGTSIHVAVKLLKTDSVPNHKVSF